MLDETGFFNVITTSYNRERDKQKELVNYIQREREREKVLYEDIKIYMSVCKQGMVGKTE